MLRTRLARTLGILFLFVTPLAAQAPSTDCTSGRARGAWDLPARDGQGDVRGVLADLAGHRLALEARLFPADADPRRGGKIVGVLMPMDRAGISGKPIADVTGTYVVEPGGLGHFVAEIVGVEARDGSRPRLVGKLGGSFADPMIDGRDPIGRFAARWTICR
jgi:hypothetical protein